MPALSLLNPVFFSASTRAPAGRVVSVISKRVSQRPLSRPANDANAISRTIAASARSTSSSSSSFPPASSNLDSSPTMPSSSSVGAGTGTLFLGGGNAAGYFAAEFDKITSADPSLKDSAFGGSLTVVSGEQRVSYERPALSKAYLNPKNPPRLPGFHSCVGGGGERQEPSWYESKGIEYRLGSEATKVDAREQTVTLADGSILSYKNLVVATGCRPVDLAKDFKMPGAVEGGGGAENGNVFYLRDVADADRLYSALEKAAAASSDPDSDSGSSGARPLVIGGGYIGLELAAALCGWGLKPVVAFPEDRILARILTPASAAFYTKFFELKGAELRPGITVKALEMKKEGDESALISSAALSDGTSLSVSLVVVGVGARPRTELFERAESGIAVVEGAPGGIKVDSCLRSVSARNVWSCGDVAAFPSGCLFGSNVTSSKIKEGGSNHSTRQEHVQHARSSAAFVARDIVSASASAPSETPSYSYLPYYYSRVFDLGWVFYGSSSSSESVVEFGDRDAEAAVRGEKQTFGSFHLEADDKGKKMIVGAFLEGGSPEQNSVMKKLVEARALVEEEGSGALGIEWASAKAANL